MQQLKVFLQGCDLLGLGLIWLDYSNNFHQFSAGPKEALCITGGGQSSIGSCSTVRPPAINARTMRCLTLTSNYTVPAAFHWLLCVFWGQKYWIFQLCFLKYKCMLFGVIIILFIYLFIENKKNIFCLKTLCEITCWTEFVIFFLL